MATAVVARLVLPVCEHTFVAIRRAADEYEEAKRLLVLGHGSFKVARLTGIPRSTIRYWNRIDHRPHGLLESYEGWRPADEFAYCYILGLYLGDGCLSHVGNAWRLIIYLDECYPTIVATAVAAVSRVVPGTPVCCNQRPGCIAVAASHAVWPHAFPQHGPGRKHTRDIVLANWQHELCRRHPKALIRGLIHSDGSRVVNRFKTALPSGRVASYAYTRYFFTNYSADIRAIFCEHCDLLGIRWTQSSFKNISVANRRSVALLDSFVGPKA